MIHEVEIKNLVTHSDDRGFFREVLRNSDPILDGKFAQWNHSKLYTGVIKAWHWHKKQSDWWYVVSGVLRIGLYDLREDSPTFGETNSFLMGDDQTSQVVRIPPGVAHGCRAIEGPVHLFYVVDFEYDRDDDIRILHDDPTIGFDWLKLHDIT